MCIKFYIFCFKLRRKRKDNNLLRTIPNEVLYWSHFSRMPSSYFVPPFVRRGYHYRTVLEMHFHTHYMTQYLQPQSFFFLLFFSRRQVKRLFFRSLLMLPLLQQVIVWIVFTQHYTQLFSYKPIKYGIGYPSADNIFSFLNKLNTTSVHFE